MSPPIRHRLRRVIWATTILTTVTGATGASAARVEPERTYTVPTSIASDCTRGQTEELNSWLESVPSGTATAPITIDFGDSTKCYLLDDVTTTSGTEYNAVRINDKSHWTLTGSATFKRSTPVKNGENRALLAITRGRHITSSSALKFTGHRIKANYDPLYEHDHNVVILGGSDISLSNFTATSVSGDNVYVAPVGDSIPHAVTIKGASLSDANRHNVAVIGTTGMTLDGNTMTNNGYWTIDAELSHGTWPLQNLVISNNTASGQRYGFLALTSRSDANIEGGPGIDNVSVTGNQVTTPGETNFEFVNINSSASADAPTDDVTIAYNSFTQHQFAISAKYVSNLKVVGNQGTTDGRGALAATCFGKLALVAGGPGLNGVTIKHNRYYSTSLWQQTSDWCQTIGASPAANDVTRGDNASFPALHRWPPFRLFVAGLLSGSS